MGSPRSGPVDPGPAGPRRRLGAELRKLRTAANLHLDDVAVRVAASTSKISRLETGKGVPKLADVRRLLDLYGLPQGDERESLMRLAREGRQQGWWKPLTEGVASERFVMESPSRYAALETEAVAVLAFETAVFHGLLQTADYTRAILTALLGDRDAGDIEQLVELRGRRQSAITRSDRPKELRAVLDESLLRRVVGSSSIMAAQLRHIARLTELANVDIRVLPFDVGFHRALAGPFVILEFPEGVGSDIVFIEGHAGDRYLEDRPDVMLYKGVLADVTRHALSPDRSAVEIIRWADRHAAVKGSPRDRVSGQ